LKNGEKKRRRLKRRRLKNGEKKRRRLKRRREED
jgi:hypothetical protein